MTDTTANYKRLWIIFLIVSIALNVVPIAVFVIQAMIDGQTVVQKVSLSMTIIVTILLTALSAISKLALRCRLWIVIIGIYVSINHFLAVIITVAICQLLDELLISPTAKYYRTKFNINKEIDNRESKG